MAFLGHKQLVVFDLDGTLANCEHRLPLIPDWVAFFNACDKDLLIHPMASLYCALALSERFVVEIWTGRSEIVKDKTIQWLRDYGMAPPADLKMRSLGDNRPDVLVKAEWLALSPTFPSLVFEDRSSVVAMYREAGVQVAQVAPGDF